MKKIGTERSLAPKITKAGLVVCFLLGLFFVFLGIRGQRSLSDASLGAEGSYQAVYALSGDVNAFWGKALSGDLDSLSAEEQAAVQASVRSLLPEIWENQREGAGKEAETLLADSVFFSNASAERFRPPASAPTSAAKSAAE